MFSFLSLIANAVDYVAYAIYGSIMGIYEGVNDFLWMISPFVFGLVYLGILTVVITFLVLKGYEISEFFFSLYKNKEKIKEFLAEEK